LLPAGAVREGGWVCWEPAVPAERKGVAVVTVDVFVLPAFRPFPPAG
jgi:hypothetical protein